MEVFEVRTKNQIEIGKKSRVYFTCHPDDFAVYFEKICEDLFQTHDCAIYYTEDMTAQIAEDEKDVDLGRNNLFVVPVTLKLLTTPNRAMDEDIPYALQNHIPVLPIMMEAGLDSIYSRPDKFGELQYLNPFSTDMTEISYAEKLKKYLQSVLVSDEMAQRIRAAFDAYIFLSYRKKDRKYANELMRLIHANPECQDIAIWFDEFLTPGESFRANIEKVLDDCKLFTLLVTPHLLETVIDQNGVERENYVVSTELPLARCKKEKTGIDIFAVEMEDTDRDRLSAIHVENPVRVDDEEFRARLLETTSNIAISSNNTPEHTFLIGLAYFDGIDVEVNRERGVNLITSAAEAGLLEAIKKLYQLYNKGVGVKVDYRKSIIWAKKIVEHYTKEFGEKHPNTLAALSDLTIVHWRLGEYQKAIEIEEKVYAIKCKVLGSEDPSTLISLSNLGSFYSDVGELKKALELKEKAYEQRCTILGEEHPDALTSLSNLALAYTKLGEIQKALELDKKAYALRCKILGEEHPDTLLSLGNLAVTYGKFGKPQKQLELEEKVYTLRCKILGEEHPDTLWTLNNLAATYRKLCGYEKALELYEKVYELRCKVLGEEHPNTLDSLNGVLLVCRDLSDHKKRLSFLEKVYEQRCKLLGEDHPKTIEVLSTLARVYREIGEYQKTLELRKKLYMLYCNAFGEEDPDTLGIMNNLVVAYIDVNEYLKALELMYKVYELRYKRLGKEHPDTLAALRNLKAVASRLKRRTQVVFLLKKFWDGIKSVFCAK
ncbi:MAG: tetratricopeptide repeat protein [Oscillospiraceae bacterium]|nr:tetratricopeptide repeat protein [Oscillospiraceae bacterium]